MNELAKRNMEAILNQGEEFSKICKNCGLTKGSHRADSIIPNQCPMHEGWMDWPTIGVTTFIDSGKAGDIAIGTPTRIKRAKYPEASTRKG